MPRDDVVFYLRSHLGRFPLENIKSQLLSEGVSEEEFKEALKAAQKAAARARWGRALMVGGGATALLAIFSYLSRKPAATANPSSAPQAAYLSRMGYAVHLPEGYAAVRTSSSDSAETVFFCKAGTDPSAFIDQGLYGGLGIVKLQALPRPFSQDPAAPSKFARWIDSQARQTGSAFFPKNIALSGLEGEEVRFDPPNPHLCAYLMGQRNLYVFWAGEDGPAYRELLNSLRETSAGE